MFDLDTIRADFPVLQRTFHGKPVVFADNAATSLKPQPVIDAVCHYYTRICSNVHRGINALAQEADALYEQAREDVAELINAEPEEMVFVRNATEGINLAAHMMRLSSTDPIVCTLSDHHSNFVPWAAHGCVKPLSPDGSGRVSLDRFREAVEPGTRLVAIGHVSNVTGVAAPAGEIVALAHAQGALALVDAAQSVPHMPVDVRELDCDFLAFSGHKMLGPSGIGGLYVRRDILEAATPMLFGGGMVSTVTADAFVPETGPSRFEAGTPNIEGALGMGAAARYLQDLDMAAVHAHARELAVALIEGLRGVPRLRLFPPDVDTDRLPIASFSVPETSAGDVAAILCNRYSIMARSGLHCAEPLIRFFGEKGVVRISLHVYNTLEEVAYIVDSVRELCTVLGGTP